MACPDFVLGAVISSEIQSEATQMQADVAQQSRGYLENQELQVQNPPEVHMEQPALPPPAGGPAFKVNKIELIGNIIFSDRQLRVYVRRYEGHLLHLKDLQGLALLITARYQMAGLLTSRAFVPPQKIYDGKVIIRVVEGRIGQISISGNRFYSNQFYFDRLEFERGMFFDINQLALSLQDINQLPDHFVKAYLEPGGEPGTSDIVIVAQESFPIHASYEYNNQGHQVDTPFEECHSFDR